MKEFKGSLIGKGKKFAIVVSRFNELLSKSLLEGAVDCFAKHGVTDDLLDVYWTPGSFEIPNAIANILKKSKYDGIVALGVIIRGDTPHFDFIASETAKGIASQSISTGIPIGFGIITADSVEQAMDRAGMKSGNKGRDAVLSVLEMTSLFDSMK